MATDNVTKTRENRSRRAAERARRPEAGARVRRRDPNAVDFDLCATD